ncbi:hypothetical protein P7K49_016579 [Saguinus oedipus]|uniref:Guanylate-binding protein/Atlastin C-terminal domain-containing protein n=1 Tax=Saguinus oedipus TaxID=9490 RepID=A0ABQ9VD31_SAGOE|nr:hypothetical protein P7K49_016579 [Saguinus oedipus]
MSENYKFSLNICDSGLRTLVVTYVDIINSGAVPCLENAVTTLAQLENSAAVQKAADHYSQQMAQFIDVSTSVCILGWVVSSIPGKGAGQADEVLWDFLQSQVVIEESILKSDRALTAGEKAIAAELSMREAAEKEQELLRQKQEEQQQIMEAQQRSFQENIAQLEKKMERERENLRREHERMLEHKLKEQEEMLIEGFEKKSEELNKEINRLKEEIETAKNEEPSVFSKILDTVGNVMIAALPGAAKLLGVGMKYLGSQV